jgi:biopolymer transport protein ExbD
VSDTPSIASRERAARASAKPVTRLNLTAMIDVVFLLMIYFMLISDFSEPEAAFELDLPKRTTSAANVVDPFALPMSPITIEVHSFGDDQSAYVLQSEDPDLANAETYESLFRTSRDMRGDTLPNDQRFIIRPMPGGRWEHALGAFNALRRAGFTEVRFATPDA